MRRQIVIMGVFGATLLLGASACSSDTDLSGTVKVDGSSTVGPLTSVAAELYSEDHSGVKVPVGTSGTGGGLEKFCRGEIDIAGASRFIKESEVKQCQKNDVSYAELPVANDALSVVVNKDNDWVECLTTDQLKQIWDADTSVTNWQQLDPSFPDQEITLFGPGTDSGTFDFFTEQVNGEDGRSTTRYTPSEDDNVLVQGVSADKSALGYFGFTYYQENSDALKAVSIDSGDGCVQPSVENAQNGTYTPLSRTLHIYVSDKALQREEVQSFVEYYIENIDEIVSEARYVPLTETQKGTLEKKYNDLKAQV